MVHSLVLLIIFVLSCFSVVAPAEGAASVTVADLPVGRAFLDSVGSGHALLSLRADWRAHFKQVQSDIRFGRVRFHGILDDDMSTYLSGKANMFNVFSSYDNILASGSTPLVELSFMPRDLALNSSNTVFHYQGGTSAPANWDQFARFITDFVGALVSRYGLEEVATWRFEVWNEPNCGFLYPYGNGCCEGPSCGTPSLYYDLYGVVSQAVKAVSSKLQVGGPATAQLGWIEDFLAHIEAKGYPIDFVSSHLYPTDPNVPAGRDGFAQLVSERAGIAAAHGLPFMLTEFNAGLGINVADDPYSAAFLIHNLVSFTILSQSAAAKNISAIESMSFWCFTDIFEEQGQISTPYSQAFGMMTNYGVPKPIYRAFQFMRSLPLEPESSGFSNISYSVSNYQNLDQIISSYIDQQGNLVYIALITNFDVKTSADSKATPGTVMSTAFFYNLNPARWTAPNFGFLEMISSRNAYAKPVWIAAGQPQYPTPSEISNELLASQLVPNNYPLLQYPDNKYGITFSLEGWASCRIKVTFQAITSDTQPSAAVHSKKIKPIN